MLTTLKTEHPACWHHTGHRGFQDDQGKVAQVLVLSVLETEAPESTMAVADAAGGTTGKTCLPSCPLRIVITFSMFAFVQ